MQMPNFLAQHSEHVSVPNPAARLTSAGLLAGIGFLGVSSWSDVAALLAAFYSFLLICEWFWKKFWRPFLERKGWIKRIRRRRTDADTDRFGYPPK